MSIDSYEDVPSSQDYSNNDGQNFEIKQLHEENCRLQQEKQKLEIQFESAMQIRSSIEAIHLENQKLKQSLHESEQKVEEYQKRFEIASATSKEKSEREISTLKERLKDSEKSIQKISQEYHDFQLDSQQNINALNDKLGEYYNTNQKSQSQILYLQNQLSQIFEKAKTYFNCDIPDINSLLSKFNSGIQQESLVSNCSNAQTIPFKDPCKNLNNSSKENEQTQKNQIQKLQYFALHLQKLLKKEKAKRNILEEAFAKQNQELAATTQKLERATKDFNNQQSELKIELESKTQSLELQKNSYENRISLLKTEMENLRAQIKLNVISQINNNNSNNNTNNQSLTPSNKKSQPNQTIQNNQQSYLNPNQQLFNQPVQLNNMISKDEHKAIISKYCQKIAQMERQIKDNASNYSKLEISFKQSMEQREKIEKENREMQTQMKLFIAERESVEEEKKLFQMQIQKLTNLQKENETKLSKATSNSKPSSNSLSKETRHKINKLQNELSTVKMQNQKIQDDYDKCQQDCSSLKHTIQQLEDRIEQAKNKENSLNQQIDFLTNQKQLTVNPSNSPHPKSESNQIPLTIFLHKGFPDQLIQNIQEIIPTIECGSFPVKLRKILDLISQYIKNLQKTNDKEKFDLENQNSICIKQGEHLLHEISTLMNIQPPLYEEFIKTESLQIQFEQQLSTFLSDFSQEKNKYNEIQNILQQICNLCKCQQIDLTVTNLKNIIRENERLKEYIRCLIRKEKQSKKKIKQEFKLLKEQNIQLNSNFNSIQRKNQELNELVNQKSKSLMESSQEKRKFENENLELKEQMDQLERQNNDLKLVYESQAKTTIEEFKKQYQQVIQDKEESLEQANEQIKKNEAKCDLLKKAVQLLKEKNQEYWDNITENKQLLANKDKEMEEKIAIIERQFEEKHNIFLQKVNEQGQEEKKTLESLTGQLKEAEKDFQKAQKQIKQLKQSNHDLNDQIKALESNNERERNLAAAQLSTAKAKMETENEEKIVQLKLQNDKIIQEIINHVFKSFRSMIEIDYNFGFDINALYNLIEKVKKEIQKEKRIEEIIKSNISIMPNQSIECALSNFLMNM